MMSPKLSASPPPACAASLPIRAGTRRPSRRAGAGGRPPRSSQERRSRSTSTAARGQHLDRLAQHRQGLEAEEVELHQPRRLDIFHVELGDRHVRARIAVERDQLVERPVADDHAGGVGRGVARQAFELHRQVEQPAHLGVARDIRRRARRRRSAPARASRGRSGGWGSAWRAGRPGRRASAAPGRYP